VFPTAGRRQSTSSQGPPCFPNEAGEERRFAQRGAVRSPPAPDGSPSRLSFSNNAPVCGVAAFHGYAAPPPPPGGQVRAFGQSRPVAFRDRFRREPQSIASEPVRATRVRPEGAAEQHSIDGRASPATASQASRMSTKRAPNERRRTRFIASGVVPGWDGRFGHNGKRLVAWRDAERQIAGGGAK
jgi:hypothetical protein